MSELDVLDLSAIKPKRKTARLRTETNPDGTLYERLSPEELSLLQLRDIGLEQKRIGELFETDPEGAEDALNKVVSTILIGAPLEDIAQLPFQPKQELVSDFSSALAARLPTAGTAPNRQARRKASAA